MKAHLMYERRDFSLREAEIPSAMALTKDLELNVLFEAMAAGDEYLLSVAKTALLATLSDTESISYRQQALSDCLASPAVIREMYAIAVEAITRQREVWGWISARYPEGTLHWSIDVLRIFLDLLKRLRQIQYDKRWEFRSPAFRRFSEMIASELSSEYLCLVEDHLERLQFRQGIAMTADLGHGNNGGNYVLCHPNDERKGWLGRVQAWMGHGRKDEFVYRVADRDEAGFKALEELRSRGVGRVATALAQSSDHILSFFTMMRLELGFYVGCLNLRDRLSSKEGTVCLPAVMPSGQGECSAHGLYDPCLRLTTTDSVIGNDVNASGKNLVVITGANGGGKSTLLRSIGIAQLMMQCGMFVPARSFRADIRTSLFTHFKREEDPSMKSGKLDEELTRMTAIVDQIRPGGMILFNESFASTNEREGSEIARQIVRALLESEVKVVYVTHMYDLAREFYKASLKNALFLRAERLQDGERTFRILEGEPLPTSHGEDLYRRIFQKVLTPVINRQII